MRLIEIRMLLPPRTDAAANLCDNSVSHEIDWKEGVLIFSTARNMSMAQCKRAIGPVH